MPACAAANARVSCERHDDGLLLAAADADRDQGQGAQYHDEEQRRNERETRLRRMCRRPGCVRREQRHGAFTTCTSFSSCTD